MNSEVKNEGLEVVAWISADGTHAEASTKSTVYGSHTIPLCRHSEALAGYAVRDARIAELEEQRDRFMASIERKHKLMNDDAAEIDQLRAELSAIKAQEPVARMHTKQIKWLPAKPSVTCSVWNRSGATPSIASFRAPLYAAPVAKQDHIEHVRAMVVPDGSVNVPVEVLRLYEFMVASFRPFTSQHEQIAISLRKAKAAMLAASPAPGDSK